MTTNIKGGSFQIRLYFSAITIPLRICLLCDNVCDAIQHNG